MCGIYGWLSKPLQQFPADPLATMGQALSHRGPDDNGEYIDKAKYIALGHNRLSIIDLTSAGHQPMVSADGRSVLVYNGELYNFMALRRELEQAGQIFYSRTDTEVVLKSLCQWGEQALHRFCGMFALAFWSADDNSLLLARDPLGMKPLYYTPLPGGAGMAFASEIKAFLVLPGFRARIDPHALRQFLEFGYTFWGDGTSLAGVRKVLPGQFLRLRQGRIVSCEAYYSPPALGCGTDSLSDRVAAVHSCLDQVVAEHLVADVPVGLLLSGGLDSSLVAALAARRTKVATISMGFAESNIDERPYARSVSRHIGSDHQEILITPDEIAGSIEEAIWTFDDLFADWGTISTRLMYKKCREQGLKVVLVGEGSDELFGGYPSFVAATTLRGPSLWKIFQLYRRYAGRRYGGLFSEFRRIMASHLSAGEGDLFHAVRLFEACNQLPNNYVMKVDKASMAVSVEARAPFLDRRVADIAFATPREFLLRDGVNKFLLREAARRYQLLPAEIIDRPKFGGSMAASWIDEVPSFREYARQVVLDPGGWVDELGLRPAMNSYFAGRRRGYRFPHAISIFSNLAWRLFQLNLWSKKYLNVG
ncbi:MAG TPA: asparagine synthase (glutamine-hydrolyzing) [Desulfobulbaceae bacterium]|nr:asparagine synthase (glutamine-hydrolyzing) [Desulfobulbaceae bacterium]